MFTSVLCVISPREFCLSLTLKGFKKKKKATYRSEACFTENKGSHENWNPRRRENAGTRWGLSVLPMFECFPASIQQAGRRLSLVDFHRPPFTSFSGPFAMGYVHHQVWFLWYKLERVLGETSESQMGYWNARPPPSQKTDLNGPSFPFFSRLFSKKSFYFGNKGCNPFIFPDIVLYILTKTNSYRQ